MAEDEIEWREVSDNLRRFLRINRLPVQKFAYQAEVHRRTIDRLLRGETIALDSLRKIEGAVGHRLTGQPITAPAQPLGAPATTSSSGGQLALSGLEFQIAERYVGSYLMTRRSFDYADGVVSSHLEIVRSPVTGRAEFRESQRNTGRDGQRFSHDFTGSVTHVPSADALQLLTIDDGFLRVITLGRPYEQVGEDDGRVMMMRGVLHTLNEIRDIGAYPVATPLHLRKTALTLDEAAGAGLLGSMRADDPSVAGIVAELDRAEEKFFEAAS